MNDSPLVKFLAGLGVVIVAVFGLIGATSKPSITVYPSPVINQPAPQPSEQQVGAVSGPDHFEYHQFFAGLGTQFLKTTSSGSSSSSPAVLTTAGSGHIVVAAAATTANASSTLINATSDKVILTQELTSPIVGVTCNTGLASGTGYTLVVVSATSTNNGFIVKAQPAAVTNPYCYNYLIVK